MPSLSLGFKLWTPVLHKELTEVTLMLHVHTCRRGVRFQTYSFPYYTQLFFASISPHIMVCSLETECCVRAVIATFGARCLKTLCSVTPEPPGLIHTDLIHTNLSLNALGTAPCGGPQAASRVDSVLHQVLGSHDRGVEGSRPLLQLCHVTFVTRLWARIPGWSKARGWTWPRC